MELEKKKNGRRWEERRGTIELLYRKKSEQVFVSFVKLLKREISKLSQELDKLEREVFSRR